jgi:methylase of polypeptide subunit release factors
MLAAAVAFAQSDSPPPRDAPYFPTPQSVVDRMLQLAKVGPEDFVIDLGSGDGRIVITAAKKYGARGLGIEIEPRLVS